jgi:hypothetical protein
MKKTLTLILLSLVLFTSSTRVQAKDLSDTLFGANKDCNFVTKELYGLFSESLTNSFPLFGSISKGSGGTNCVNVSRDTTDMFKTGFKVFLALVTMIAVYQVSVAGIKWMLTEKDVGGKRTAKQMLTNSIAGLILALAAWAILYGVNPRLLMVGLNLGGLQEGIAIGLTNSLNAPNVAPVPAGGTTGGGTAGSIAGPKGKFPDQTWADKARGLIESSGLNNLNPSDAAKFFPNGKPTTEGYVRLFEEMIARESSFKADKSFPEPELGYNSVGLFQLSAIDFNYKYTEAQLKDPYLNLELGIQRFKTLVQRGNCIACGDSNSAEEAGAAAYWRVLKTSAKAGKQQEIINALKQ